MAGNKHKKIRKRRAEIRHLHAEGLDTTTIAETLGVGIQTVYTDQRHLGLTPNTPADRTGAAKTRAQTMRRRCVQCGSRKDLSTFRGLRLCGECTLKYDEDPLYEERQRYEAMRGFRSSALGGAI